MICKKDLISKESLFDFIMKIDKLFVPSLSEKLNFQNYIDKIYTKSEIIFYIRKQDIKGLVAFLKVKIKLLISVNAWSQIRISMQLVE